jgi:hypothetical protein
VDIIFDELVRSSLAERSSKGDRIALTQKGFLVSDAIFEKLVA